MPNLIPSRFTHIAVALFLGVTTLSALAQAPVAPGFATATRPGHPPGSADRLPGSHATPPRENNAAPFEDAPISQVAFAADPARTASAK